MITELRFWEKTEHFLAEKLRAELSLCRLLRLLLPMQCAIPQMPSGPLLSLPSPHRPTTRGEDKAGAEKCGVEVLAACKNCWLLPGHPASNIASKIASKIARRIAIRTPPRQQLSRRRRIPTKDTRTPQPHITPTRSQLQTTQSGERTIHQGKVHH